jgi:hypothetical protein
MGSSVSKAGAAMLTSKKALKLTCCGAVSAEGDVCRITSAGHHLLPERMIQHEKRSL